MAGRTITAKAPAVKMFTEENAYETFRVFARNSEFTGQTEGIGFSNGMATVSALPRSVTCDREAGDCFTYNAASGDICRVHERVRHLNNLMNYPWVERVQTPSGMRPVIKNSYRVLSEAEYEEEAVAGQDGVTFE